MKSLRKRVTTAQRKADAHGKAVRKAFGAALRLLQELANRSKPALRDVEKVKALIEVVEDTTNLPMKIFRKKQKRFNKAMMAAQKNDPEGWLTRQDPDAE